MGPTQIILVALFYAMSSTVTSGRFITWVFFKKNISKEPTGEVNLKELFYKVLTGIIGMLALDLLSGGNPIWPALGLIAGFMGETYPWARVNLRTDIGIVYFGAVFYLYPVIAVTSLGLSLPNLLFGKDSFLAIIVLTSIIPVLFKYSETNPWFLVSAIIVELLTVFYFRKILWQRLSPKK